jgi:hypothetical protein
LISWIARQKFLLIQEAFSVSDYNIRIKVLKYLTEERAFLARTQAFLEHFLEQSLADAIKKN